MSIAALLRIILAFSLSTSSPVHAESTDQQALRRGLETAGRVTGEQLVRGFLDKTFPIGSAAGAGASAANAGAQAGQNAAGDGAKSSITVGGGFVFAVSLGLSIDEFAKAKTDKAKGYAAANAVAAGIALAFPVAGLVAAAIILVVRLVDVSISAAHAKELMEIYARVNKLYEESIKMEDDMLNSEKAKFAFAFDQLSSASDNLQEGQKYLKDNCAAAESIDTQKKIDDCLKSTIQLIEEFQRVVDYSQSLLAPTTRILKVASVFQAAKMDISVFQRDLDNNRANVKKMRDELNKTLKGYGEFMASMMIHSAQTEAMKDLPVLFKGECLSKTHLLTMQAMILLDPDHFKGMNAELGQRTSDIHQMRDLMEQFQYSGCSNVPSGDQELDRLYDGSNEVFLQTYDQIIKAGA